VSPGVESGTHRETQHTEIKHFFKYGSVLAFSPADDRGNGLQESSRSCFTGTPHNLQTATARLPGFEYAIYPAREISNGESLPAPLDELFPPRHATSGLDLSY